MKKNTYLFSYLVSVLLVVMFGLSGPISAAGYDLVEDDYIDWQDLDAFAVEWLNDCNATNNWCNGANFDDDNNNVDFDDYTLWAKRWLTQPSLVGWWRFEEGSGSIAYDSSGYDNDGTLNGDPNWVAGREGLYALDFDADGDYVNVPDIDGSLDIDSNLTIAAWVRLNSVGAHATIVNKQPSGTAGDNYPGNYTFFVRSSTGMLRLAHQTTTGTTSQYYESTTAVSVGDWDHVAVTLVEGDSVKFYIDGSPAGTSPQSATWGILNDEPLRIGVRKDMANGFNGRMDDVRIYNRALSEANIADIAGTAGWAKNPYPSNGATYVDSNVVLSWTPADDANSHDVYFGTDLNDVSDANNSWPVATGPDDPNVYKGNFDVNSFDPCGLDVDTVYYWRIDEVNDANIPCKGPIWTFSTDTFGAPVANFSVIPTSGWDIYYKPEFISKSTGDITSYLWEFGDTQTSTDRAPNHQYSSASTYTVTLTVTGPDGSDSMTKVNHITVNDFNDYPYADYNITDANMTQWDNAVDAIETAGGGRILFDFNDQTIYVNHDRDFFGNNCIVDGQDKNVKFYYSGPDDCSQTEGQDALIRFHGNDNIFRNLDFDRFPEGVHMRGGNRNLIENCNVNTICEDAMTMNGGGYECFDCIIRDCSYGESEDKAVMVNNGGRGVFRNLDFTDSTQPIRCTGSTGEYVIRYCDVGGNSNSFRHSGGSPGQIAYVEENTVSAKRGIRVYDSAQAIIRHNTFSNGSYHGVYVYGSAKARLEHNNIQNFTQGGVMVQNTAQVDLGGGSVSIDGSSATSIGDNTIQSNSPYDLINQTASTVKAKFNYWDHTTVADVLLYDVDGNADVDPLGKP